VHDGNKTTIIKVKPYDRDSGFWLIVKWKHRWLQLCHDINSSDNNSLFTANETFL